MCSLKQKIDKYGAIILQDAYDTEKKAHKFITLIFIVTTSERK